MVILASILTVFIALIGTVFSYVRWDYEHSDVLFGLTFFFAITSIFGIANVLQLQIDHILYPVRIVVMLWIIYAVIKK